MSLWGWLGASLNSSWDTTCKTLEAGESCKRKPQKYGWGTTKRERLRTIFFNGSNATIFFRDHLCSKNQRGLASLRNVFATQSLRKPLPKQWITLNGFPIPMKPLWLTWNDKHSVATMKRGKMCSNPSRNQITPRTAYTRNMSRGRRNMVRPHQQYFSRNDHCPLQKTQGLIVNSKNFKHMSPNLRGDITVVVSPFCNRES